MKYEFATIEPNTKHTKSVCVYRLPSPTEWFVHLCINYSHIQPQPKWNDKPIHIFIFISSILLSFNFEFQIKNRNEFTFVYNDCHCCVTEYVVAVIVAVVSVDCQWLPTFDFRVRHEIKNSMSTSMDSMVKRMCKQLRRLLFPFSLFFFPRRSQPLRVLFLWYGCDGDLFLFFGWNWVCSGIHLHTYY